MTLRDPAPQGAGFIYSLRLKHTVALNTQFNLLALQEPNHKDNVMWPFPVKIYEYPAYAIQLL